ncbi:MAG: hypothetical protein Q8P41_31840 [Pseudomonadota bacterium]|nr:hypothetical protein [Pseudomonadota bacterium]
MTAPALAAAVKEAEEALAFAADHDYPDAVISEAAVRVLLSALRGPVPSTDPWRACGCPNPDDCEHVYYGEPVGETPTVKGSLTVATAPLPAGVAARKTP